jgi:aminopeptidase N
VFERSKRLLAHPDFKLANPNRARSLIGTFCLGNPAGFHRADGAGYAFWADRVIALDAINPQPPRASPRPRPLEPPRRALSLGGAGGDRAGRAQPKLSDDTHEIVSRALAGA